MSSLSLYWLPQNTSWDSELKTVSKNANATWQDFVVLARNNIDFVQTVRLEKVLSKRFSSAPSDPNILPIRLAILGSGTLEHLSAGIKIAGLRQEMWIEPHFGNFGQFRQELEDKTSSLHAFKPQAILFAFDAAAILGPGDPSLNQEEADQLVAKAISQLKSLWPRAADLCHGQVIQQTFLPTAPPLIGNNEHRLPGSLYSLTTQLNSKLRHASTESGIDLLAIDERIAIDGLLAWHNPTFWHHAKQEVSPVATPLYGDLVIRLIAARHGRSSKCLVLDLDNTLWGGVIGDDGVNNIALGQGSAAGEAFVAFQRYAKELSLRGIILAVCSKNDQANALAPFTEHPEMVLKRSDIACFVANWQDKAANIRAIASSLNIGLNSLVFADDNIFERTMVRRELPMVKVLELPSDPSEYARCISDSGYFEATSITADDLTRSRQYQGYLERQALMTASSDVEGYLKSLSMKLVWGPINEANLQRVTQLINKTNQFNLTTRRYTELEVAQMMRDERCLTLQCRLVDALGDNGIISVIIAKPKEDDAKTLYIDTWLMSCRVLGRQVEEAVLNLLAQQALKFKAKTLLGEYKHTEKNGMVRDHYSKIGFDTLESGKLWTYALDNFVPHPTFIEIVESQI